MNVNYKITIVLVWTILVISLFANSGKVEVEVSDIEEETGKLIICVYDKPGFLVNGKEIFKLDVVVEIGSQCSLLDDIPPGRYALLVFHDKNNDGVLNRDFFGHPTEPYGFSKNKKGFLGPPSFQDVEFEVIKEKKSLLKIYLLN